MSCSGECSTPVFSVGTSEYVRTEARGLLFRWCWVPALLVAAAAIAGFHDNRYWFLGLMLVFIVYPMAMSFTWLLLAGSKHMSRLCRPQSLSVREGVWTINFYPFEYDPETIPEPLHTTVFTDNDISEVECGGRYYRINLQRPADGIPFILIPATLLSPEFISKCSNLNDSK